MRPGINAFGGNFYEVIIGGAAFNQEVESFLHSVGFKYTVGYGATECAPIICYEDYKTSYRALAVRLPST